MPSFTFEQFLSRQFDSITDEPEPGTVTYSSSITDEQPEKHVAPYLPSPSDQADQLAEMGPDETYEEYMERHAHE